MRIESQTIPGRVVSSLIALGVSLAALAAPSTSSADLAGRQQTLQQGIAADNQTISSLAQRLGDLRGRLTTVEGTMATQQASLTRIQNAMYDASHELTHLRDALNLDQRVLAEAHTHQLRVVAATLSERDRVESLRLAILTHERVAVAGRSQRESELAQVRHQLAVLRARAVAAQRAAFAATEASSGAISGGAGLAPSGDDGFFPAAGTNYRVNEEPEIASRLNTLGKALHLHLIGISGYRSPERSLEVGGFADDPHTRGEASDTPGIEGVPESTLEQYGLTRPFPGPAEADHIQLS